MNKLTKILAVVVVTCLAIGYFSGTVTRSAIIDWYPTLVKPVLIPRLDFCAGMEYVVHYESLLDWFGIVWTRIKRRKKALILFATTGAKCFVVVFILVTPC
jgi:tryptophan-rich sensory protein